MQSMENHLYIDLISILTKHEYNTVKTSNYKKIN